MQRQTFLHLLTKYADGNATDAERRLLEEYYRRLEISSDVELSEQEQEELQLLMLRNIKQAISPKIITLNTKPSFKWWYAAAAVLLLCSVGSYMYLNNAKSVKTDKQYALQPIKPGSNKATLTLSNGKTLVLNTASNGLLATQGATKVIKGANGQIIYDAESATSVSAAADNNTITIPRGGQYQVILPDGSKVLLNAASSLTYPTAFGGNTRTVVLRGEAYFEISQNKQKPFIVHANGTAVKVLGTHFEISAYQDDDAVTTTLLEGSVNMQKGATSTRLKPGEQGIAVHSRNTINVQKANTEQVMAWTRGQFVFNDVSIKEVMKIASRWYDVDVEYHGNVQYKKFGGTTSKYKNITELLDNMSAAGGIHYKIDGRRVILMN